MNQRSVLSLIPLLSLTAAAPLSLHAQGTDWRMEVRSDEWHLAGFENSLDISGIASATGEHCLVGSDESFYVQPGAIDREKRRIESRRPIALPLESGGDGMEIDIEGVAFSERDRAYYVAGSHGVGKKKGDIQPDRHAFYRVPVDPESGRVDPKGIRRASLLPWIAKTALLAPHLNQPLQRNGLNVEGLACSDGRLFVGLRSPHKDGTGFVIEMDPNELFDDEPRELEVHALPLRSGRGIREIAAVRDGFILLTGNASAEATRKIPTTLAAGPDNLFEVFFWAGGTSKPVEIGRLPRNGGKAEALLVLEDTAAHVDLLVVFDSLPGGLPLELRLHR